MLSKTQLTGALLPHKTLCLTFDDGPGETFGSGAGPKTIQLAQYLWEEKITATFFVVGKFVEKSPYILQGITMLGHIIANHSYNHPNFLDASTFAEGEDFASELAKTDAVIARYNPTAHFFRAPYGFWAPEITASVTENFPGASKYIGPVYWDIDAADWSFWRDGKTAQECANAYLEKIEAAGRGIILMHDSTADTGIFGYRLRNSNRTFETIKILVPQLKSLGYTFVGLDRVPLQPQPEG